MKKKTSLARAATCAGALAMTASACAGLYAEQDIETKDGVHRVTIRVQDGMARFDLNNGSSVLVDAKKQLVTTLFYHDAIANTERGEEALRSAAETVSTRYAPPRQAPKMREEKLGGYDCHVSDWAWGTFRQVIWVTPKYPDSEKFQADIETLRFFHCYCLPAITPEGMALKTVTGSVGHLRTTTLVTARSEKIPPDVFEIAPTFTRHGK